MLGEIEQFHETGAVPLKSLKQHWLNRTSLPIELLPDVYICTPTQPLYLITAFRNSVVFCFISPDQSEKRPRTIFVANDIIYALEFAKK